MTRLASALATLLVLLAGPAVAAGGKADQPFDPFGVAGIDRIEGARAPLDAALTDETGRSVTLRALAHGKPIVLAPVQHRCPNLCGFTLEGLAHAVRTQPYSPGADFEIVALGFDPRETPKDAQVSAERLRSRLDPGAARAGVAALVGPAAKAVTDALGYRYAWDPRIGQYAHVAAFAVLTPDGRLARWIYGIQPEGSDLRLALTEAGEGRIGGWGEQLLLLCYHYDPQTGRYGQVVWTSLRLAGAATVLGLAALIAVQIARDPRRRGPS